MHGCRGSYTLLCPGLKQKNLIERRKVAVGAGPPRQAGRGVRHRLKPQRAEGWPAPQPPVGAWGGRSVKSRQAVCESASATVPAGMRRSDGRGGNNVLMHRIPLNTGSSTHLALWAPGAGVEQRPPLIDQAPPVAARQQLLCQLRHAHKGGAVAVLRHHQRVVQVWGQGEGRGGQGGQGGQCSREARSGWRKAQERVRCAINVQTCMRCVAGYSAREHKQVLTKEHGLETPHHCSGQVQRLGAAAAAGSDDDGSSCRRLRGSSQGFTGLPRLAAAGERRPGRSRPHSQRDAQPNLQGVSGAARRLRSGNVCWMHSALGSP